MPLLLHSVTIGKSAASPRRGDGRVLADWVQRGRPVSDGKTPAVTSGSTTTGHSRPLALCTVISLTLSAGVGRRSVQAPVELLGCPQERQEGAHARVAVEVRE